MSLKYFFAQPTNENQFEILIFFFNSDAFSAGGLVTAVAPVVINGNGIWVGWPGMHMEDPTEPIPESDPNDRTPTAGLLSKKVCELRITYFLKRQKIWFFLC